MKERERLINLYDIYKSLLTENQRKCFENYYYEDLSLSEISDNLKVSKSFISKTLNLIETKLNTYEKNLGNLELQSKISEIAQDCKDPKTKEKLENLLN